MLFSFNSDAPFVFTCTFKPDITSHCTEPWDRGIFFLESQGFLLVTVQLYAYEVAVNHRITECFGLEGTFRCHLVQPPCSEQGHLQLDQAAQSPVQPDLECFQGWATLGNLFQCFTTLTAKNFFLISSLNLPSLSLKQLPVVLSQQALLRCLSPSFL